MRISVVEMAEEGITQDGTLRTSFRVVFYAAPAAAVLLVLLLHSILIIQSSCY